MADRQPDTAAEPSAPLVAASSVADERTRVLKHDDTFGVFDHYGDVKPAGLGEEGLYHAGTRHLSTFLLDLDGERPFFLNSTVLENDQLTVQLTNPARVADGRVTRPLGTVHLAVRKFLWRGVLYEELRLRNLGLEPLVASLGLRFAADFVDIFEVRGVKRPARGVSLSPEVGDARVVLRYRGLDGDERRTVLSFAPAPALLTDHHARLDVALAPREEAACVVTVACERRGAAPRVLAYDEARAEAQAHLERFQSWACHVGTSDGLVDSWLDRAVADLHMLTSDLPTGQYPYAGVPWFSTEFGRDGLITALECLWMRPQLARGVLSYLASVQATEVIPEEDAEPGKILHEARRGEMAAVKEVPFGRYYGTVDATPLFVLLAGEYYRRTGDRALVEALWPNVRAALAWMDGPGDHDGDGFLDYAPAAERGLRQQGWRDSDDAVFHADGSPAEPPIALCEVQGYAYAAHRAAALLADVLGDAREAEARRRRAEELRERFERAFWLEDLSTYALALDARGPCRVASSAAGQCLFTGIVSPERAERVARTLFSPESFSGWGIRTIAACTPRYSPLSYHDGSIWPHDNALVALGLARNGFGELALRLFDALYEAGVHFPLQRMPELFCGFPRRPGEGPILYPVACAPQAWSAASVLLLVQACIGIEVDAPGRRVVFTRPRLPGCLSELRLHNLEVGESRVDLALVRHRHNVGVDVLSRDANVRIVVVK